MEIKKFNGRFVPKGDTEENWNKAVGFIPLDKEIIIYKVDEEHSAARFKIGDGKTVIQDLPFAGTDIEAVEKLIDEKGELLIEYADNAVAEAIEQLNSELPTNLENGEGSGSLQQIGYIDENEITVLSAIASGDGAVAFGGQRYDKAGKSVEEEPQTEAKGIQSFAQGGGVVVEGAWSAGFGKDNRAYQKAAFAIGGGSQTGRTEEEFNAWFWDSENGVALHNGRGLNADGKILDDTGSTYEKSYSFAFVSGDSNTAVGRASFIGGGSKNTTRGKYAFVGGGQNNQIYGEHSGIVAGTTNSVNSNNSVVIGGANNIIQANAGNSVVLAGRNNIIHAVNSIASGEDNNVTTKNSAVFGTGLTTGDYIAEEAPADMVIVGRYNRPDSNAIFQVGTGSADTMRNSALTILHNGIVRVPTVAAGDDSSVTNVGYVNKIKDYATTYARSIFDQLTADIQDMIQDGAGKYSATVGMSNTVAAQGAFAAGSGNTIEATATYALAEGQQNIVKAVGAHAEGAKNTIEASASYAHVEGWENVVSGTYAHAQGLGNTVSGSRASASGHGLRAEQYAQFIVGKFNSNATNTLFEVGNGTAEKRSNAFEVCTDGYAKVGRQTVATDDSLTLVTKGYVDSLEKRVAILEVSDGTEISFATKEDILAIFNKEA